MSEASKRWLVTGLIVAGFVAVMVTKQPHEPDTTAPAAGPATASEPTAAERALEAAKGLPVFLCFRSGVTMEGHCIPCVEMARITAELAPKYKDRVAFINVSLDDDTNEWGLIEKYQVRVKPTNVLLDRKGQVVEQRLGVWPVEELVARLEQVSR